MIPLITQKFNEYIMTLPETMEKFQNQSLRYQNT